ncbi:MAG: DUF2089 domain-containing protein [Gammaproteobacteria bacterium]|nr:DUF2089 domain-containing protein [Gammaproteobacteria bacterium]
MKKQVIGKCPICNHDLYVKTLRCEECETEVTGEFTLSPFDYLTKEQIEFALVFIQNEGNIKGIEKSLNISYPTVKKNIDDLVRALGFTVEEENMVSRDDIKRKLKNGEITFDEAEDLLGGNL